MAAGSGFAAVMKLAREQRYIGIGGPKEQRDWLSVVAACYRCSIEYGNHFPGANVMQAMGGMAHVWFPGLRTLAKYGIVISVGPPSRGGSRRYYTMPDPSGVRAALQQLGVPV